MAYLIALALAQAALPVPPAPAPPARIMTPDEARQWTMMARTRMIDGQERSAMLKGKRKKAALSGQLAGVTRLVLVPDFGLYAAYSAPDGSLYGWFPGQQAAVAGRWGVEKFGSDTIAACFRFQRPGRTREGKFQPDECAKPYQTLGATDVVESWAGDVFRLAAGTVPHVKQPWEMVTP